MAKKKSHKKKSDLVGFGVIALNHWKKFRPKLFQHLLKKGELYDQLYEAGDQAEKFMQKEQSKPGFNLAMDYHSLKEIALRTWILLPDVDQEAESRPPILPRQTTASPKRTR